MSIHRKINEPHLTTKQSMEQRLNECAVRWLGQRSQNASIDTCKQFIQQCLELGIDNSLAITQRHLDCYKMGLENRHLSPSTINTRLCSVKAYIEHVILHATLHGFDDEARAMLVLKFNYETRPKQAKWHMTDAQYEQCLPIMAGLVAGGKVNTYEAGVLGSYVNWTFETGLRVEETLRLLPADFGGLDGERPALTVPGTKNEQSRVRIPISLAARDIIVKRMAERPSRPRIFDISYDRLHSIWQMLREALGLADNPTATLKALRRNFALNALRKGLPPRIIQELMRHSSLETTMSYLRLMGMSDNDETRALLNRQLNQQAALEVQKAHDTLDLYDTTDLIAALVKRGYGLGDVIAQSGV